MPHRAFYHSGISIGFLSLCLGTEAKGERHSGCCVRGRYSSCVHSHEYLPLELKYQEYTGNTRTFPLTY